ncbi:MAG: AAA family ATPase [Gemmatimonadales bacterium]
MTDFAAWEAANEEYLRTALSWLRLRLERQTTPAAPAEPTVVPVPRAPRTKARRPSMLDRLLGRSPARPPVAKPSPTPGDRPEPRTLIPAVARAAREGAVAEVAAGLERLAAADPPPALVILARRLGLSAFEQQVLLLAVAMELDPAVAGLCAAAQGNASRPYPTFALAMTAFDDPSWDVLSPERPLRFWRLLEVTASPSQPLTAGVLRADERIVNFAKGLNHLDERLALLLAPVSPPIPLDSLPPSEEAVAEQLASMLGRQDRPGPPPAVQLLGTDSSSKQVVAARVATRLGVQLYRLGADLLPTLPAEIETLAILCQREALLIRLGLYVEPREADVTPEHGHSNPLSRFLARVGGVRFIDTRDLRPEFGPAAFAVEVAKPTPAEQLAAWRALLGAHAGDHPRRLSSQFDLALPRIHDVAEQALAEGADDPERLKQRLWAACLASARPRLDQLAQRIDARARWPDLILPEAELGLLRQLMGQVLNRSVVYDEWKFAEKMNRGLGISALFAGESGTGKTMAAEVIANELGLGLYRIDLSAVVSKYIGETEKNLRRLFDAAEDGGAILFFDECDAIFGKRSEVKDSHDRYANIEINYLLQRMETYRGLAILATNMKSGLDRAFLRRLRFTIEFPFPGTAERKRIWRQVFPAGMNTSALDFDRLARLSLTGGSIHNIALNSAFLAAGADGAVTMPRVLEAARGELRKMERPVSEAELRWIPPAPAPAAGVGAA